MPRAARLLAAATALLLGLPVAAQVLYKWTDAQGRVQYSDQKPKNFAGEVTRLEQDAKPDTPAPIAPAVPGKASTPSEREAEGAPAKDLATQRRTTREALALRLEKARANLVTARKALEDGINPAPDEQQVVRQIQQAGQGGMHGQTQSRSNCSQVIRNGKVVGVMCPSLAPKEEYFERQSRLEAAVKAAEEEVDAAELAYRRGVD